MKTQALGALVGASLLMLSACGDKGTGTAPEGTAAPAAAPAVQLPTAKEIEAEAAVSPEDADAAFEQLKREIEADS